MSKKTLALGVCVLMLLLVVFSSGCIEEGFETKTGDLEILSSEGKIKHSELMGWDEATVTGQAKNVGDKVLSYASVEAKFYDSAGNLLGHSLDNINDLAPGETWSFKITYYDDTCTVKSYKVYVGSCW